MPFALLNNIGFTCVYPARQCDHEKRHSARSLAFLTDLGWVQSGAVWRTEKFSCYCLFCPILRALPLAPAQRKLGGTDQCLWAKFRPASTPRVPEERHASGGVRQRSRESGGGGEGAFSGDSQTPACAEPGGGLGRGGWGSGVRGQGSGGRQRCRWVGRAGRAETAPLQLETERSACPYANKHAALLPALMTGVR